MRALPGLLVVLSSLDHCSAFVVAPHAAATRRPLASLAPQLVRLQADSGEGPEQDANPAPEDLNDAEVAAEVEALPSKGAGFNVIDAATLAFGFFLFLGFAGLGPLAGKL